MAQLIYVEVAIRIADGVDPNTVIEDCNYSFQHKHIIDTEIVSIANNDTDENVYGD